MIADCSLAGSLRAQLAAPRVITPEILASTLAAPPRPTIKDLITLVDSVPQLEIPVTHSFIKDEYWREITMPAGMTGVGHVHRHRHQNIALAGKALVTCDGITMAVEAPFVFESQPGAQKAFQVIEDLRWVTIHENPNGWGPDDIVEIEREIFERGSLLAEFMRRMLQELIAHEIDESISWDGMRVFDPHSERVQWGEWGDQLTRKPARL